MSSKTASSSCSAGVCLLPLLPSGSSTRATPLPEPVPEPAPGSSPSVLTVPSPSFSSSPPLPSLLLALASSRLRPVSSSFAANKRARRLPALLILPAKKTIKPEIRNRCSLHLPLRLRVALQFVSLLAWKCRAPTALSPKAFHYNTTPLPFHILASSNCTNSIFEMNLNILNFSAPSVDTDTLRNDIGYRYQPTTA